MRLQENPVSFNVAPDTRVLLFTTAAALFSGLLFGLAPALRSSRIDLASALKGTAGSVAGNASMQRLNQALVVVQVAQIGRASCRERAEVSVEGVALGVKER